MSLTRLRNSGAKQLVVQRRRAGRRSELLLNRRRMAQVRIGTYRVRKQVLCLTPAAAPRTAFPALIPRGCAVLPDSVVSLTDAQRMWGLNSFPFGVQGASPEGPSIGRHWSGEARLSPSRASGGLRTRSASPRRSPDRQADRAARRARRCRSLLAARPGELRSLGASSRKSLARHSGAQEGAGAIIGSVGGAAQETGASSLALV